MQMDASSDGLVGKLMSRATLVALTVSSIAIFIAGTTAVVSRLDRNLNEIEQVCLSVQQLRIDLRFHMLSVPSMEDRKLPKTPSVPVDC